MCLQTRLRLHEKILKNRKEESWQEHFLQMAKKQQIMYCVTRPTVTTTQDKLLHKISSTLLRGPNLSRRGNVGISRISRNRPQTTDPGPPGGNIQRGLLIRRLREHGRGITTISNQ